VRTSCPCRDGGSGKIAFGVVALEIHLDENDVSDIDPPAPYERHDVKGLPRSRREPWPGSDGRRRGLTDQPRLENHKLYAGHLRPQYEDGEAAYFVTFANVRFAPIAVIHAARMII